MDKQSKEIWDSSGKGAPSRHERLVIVDYVGDKKGFIRKNKDVLFIVSKTSEMDYKKSLRIQKTLF